MLIGDFNARTRSKQAQMTIEGKDLLWMEEIDANNEEGKEWL